MSSMERRLTPHHWLKTPPAGGGLTLVVVVVVVVHAVAEVVSVVHPVAILQLLPLPGLGSPPAKLGSSTPPWIWLKMACLHTQA